MRKLLPLSILPVIILLLCLSNACKKPAPAPTDCFAALPDTVYVAQSVTFTSCTKGATSYLWNFGDGSTATTDSATHTYMAAGVYHGSLTTSNGQSSTKTFTIVVVANAAGYFTIGSSSFFPSYCDSFYQSGLQAIVISSPNILFGFAFYDSIPVASGTYSTKFGYASQVMPGQVAVGLEFNNDSIYSSATSSVKNVNVTVLPNGKLNIVGTKIEMINLTNSSDSLSISFNITQTQ